MRWTSSILCSKPAEAFIKMYLQHSFLPFSLLERAFSHLSLLISPPSLFCAVLSHPLRILLLSLFPFRFPSHTHPSLFLPFAFLIFLFHPVIPLLSQLHTRSLCLFHPAPYSSVALLLFIYLFTFLPLFYEGLLWTLRRLDFEGRECCCLYSVDVPAGPWCKSIKMKMHRSIFYPVHYVKFTSPNFFKGGVSESFSSCHPLVSDVIHTVTPPSY